MRVVLRCRKVGRRVVRAHRMLTDPRHRAEKITTVAYSCGFGDVSYFNRVFRRHYGLTPHAYLINRRVQHGQHLLRQGLSLADAALSAGFADQAHMNRDVLALTQLTPGEIQRQMRG